MIIKSVAEYKKALTAIKRCKTLVVDLETDGLRPWHGNRTCGVAVKAGKQSFYFPFRHGQGYNLPLELLEPLMVELSRPDKLYIGFNYKFDIQFMLQDGAAYPEHAEDVMLAAHLMNENEPSLQLKKLGDKYIREGSSDEQKTLYQKLAAMGYKGKEAGGHMWRLDCEDVGPYAIQDVELTWALREFYLKHLKVWKLYTLYQEVSEYLVITTKMEAAGLLIDVELMKQYMQEASEMVKPAKERLNELAGYEINANSHKQLQSLIGLPSTAADVLEDVREHPRATEFQKEVADAILKYRGWAKVNSTYYTKYLTHIDQYCRIRTSLMLSGTISGRLSSRGPNLHAVPQYDEVYKVKDIFIAREGYTMVSCDYSQAELRLAAHYTKDPTLIDIFLRDLDLHQMTAEMVGITRRQAKTINFGIIYGLGANGLSGQLGIPLQEARKLLNGYHKKFPYYRVLYRECERMGTLRGYIRMWTGRVRRYGPSSPPHKAMPNLIQGGVAEIMRVTITRLHRELAQEGLVMLHQVHDQIIFEVPDEKVDELVPKIVNIMQDFNFRVPMKVDTSIGKRWGKLTDWKAA